MEKKVLILGAGLVAQPIVRYLLEKGLKVTVASNTPDNAEAMINKHKNGININWSVEDKTTLDKMVKENDVVVSLLPYVFHTLVAEYALKHNKNMITASYVKPEMQALDDAAKKAGIIILNELGLDPGIDHMSAMRIIDNVHEKGGKIKEFYSLCGALPAPEAANNPFKYKFSWSPKGVVMAGNNDAMYLRHGKVVDVPTKLLFKNPFKINFPEVGELEVYPNRDSIAYKEIYGIPEAETMYRGTFRFKGWCETIDALKQLNLISYDKMKLEGMTYADFIAKLINENDSSNIKAKVKKYLGSNATDYAIDTMEWLGIFENKPMNRKEDSPFEITSDLMIAKMQLGQTERDMVVMQHTFLAEYEGGKKEVIRSSMLDFGTLATDTSIARTVALPAAVGVIMVLENKIKVKGVFRPVIPEIYNPILDELETMNIKMIEEYGLPESENIK
ncbi:MAG TPA: saccharopine dehydrogenase C-terminal domain-containing protein [Bacteroidales bacterium]|nr:saccharopine dehydrogenase C-terminal domain-containing protein [Bacteroidales bacterium]HPS17105.1 saccharopine dehydrogenase C-terminal domain-containing protein [Bacteroidales bacterium]